MERTRTGRDGIQATKYRMHIACTMINSYLYKKTMPTLQIRKLPDYIYQALKTAAEHERRSLSQQAIITLAKGLDVPLDFRERRKEVLAEIRKEAPLWKKWAHVDVAAWTREDRDSR